MPREHWNDVPGDIAGSDAENLPGGFGTDNPDNNADATVDELIDTDVTTPVGDGIYWKDQRGGVTSGAGYAEAADNGSTVDPADLLEGEEAHPGAAIGFTGAEPDKRGPSPEEMKPKPRMRDEMPTPGGTPTEKEASQQRENISTESAGPVGAEGAGGTVQPEDGKAAA